MVASPRDTHRSRLSVVVQQVARRPWGGSTRVRMSAVGMRLVGTLRCTPLHPHLDGGRTSRTCIRGLRDSIRDALRTRCGAVEGRRARRGQKGRHCCSARRSRRARQRCCTHSTPSFRGAVEKCQLATSRRARWGDQQLRLLEHSGVYRHAGEGYAPSEPAISASEQGRGCLAAPGMFFASSDLTHRWPRGLRTSRWASIPRESVSTRQQAEGRRSRGRVSSQRASRPRAATSARAKPKRHLRCVQTQRQRSALGGF